MHPGEDRDTDSEDEDDLKNKKHVPSPIQDEPIEEVPTKSPSENIENSIQLLQKTTTGNQEESKQNETNEVMEEEAE